MLDLKELHILLDSVLSPRFEPSPELHKGRCQKCLDLLSQAIIAVSEELDKCPSEINEQSIKHTLDNTQLEQLPDEIEDDNPLTIHGEK